MPMKDATDVKSGHIGYVNGQNGTLIEFATDDEYVEYVREHSDNVN